MPEIYPPGPLDLLQLIRDLRTDLCRRFGFHLPQNRDSYVSWLVTSGSLEYQALAEDAGFARYLHEADHPGELSRLHLAVYNARPDVRQAFPLPEQLPAYLQWYLVHGVAEHQLWPWLRPLEKQLACQLSGPHQAQLQAWAAADHLAKPPRTTAGRPFGVNLVGYAYGQLGIGEDVRMAAKALLAASIPVCMVNFKPGRDIPQNDHSMAHLVVPEGEEGPYAINLFCLTALEHGRFFAEQGPAQMRGRYNIGYWPWELSRWPDAWRQLVHLVDELWVSTQHTLESVQPVWAAVAPPSRLHCMPMAVELEPLDDKGNRAALRRQHGLPEQAILFCFSFDLHSAIHRKNPQATVQAFLQAFATDAAAKWNAAQVGLVIKVHPPKRRHASWERLKTLAASDGRIHLVEQTLSRPEVLALYQACDCFVSLHRAEGFGRGIAEALQLGLHVIATDYSGNVDFCQRPEFQHQIDKVRYRLIKVRSGHYPYHQHQVWADPDIPHAAQCMRAFAQRTTHPLATVPQGGWPVFGSQEVGQRYRQRLQEIAAQHAQVNITTHTV